MIRLGIIGTGRIAKRFVYDAWQGLDVEIVGVYNPHMESAEKFCAENHVKAAYSEWNLFIHAIEAVYVASPLGTHAEYVKKALEAGIHVLCEKPMVVSGAQAEELFALADEKQCVLMEGIKTAYSPGYKKLRELLEEKPIGEIRDVEACFTKLVKPGLREWTHLEDCGSMTELGSYGCFAVLSILGEDYVESHHVSLRNEDGVDIFTKVFFSYHSYAMGLVKSGIGVKSEGELLISGTKGYILVKAPWWMPKCIEVHFEDANKTQIYTCEYVGNGLQYELEHFVKRIKGTQMASGVTKEQSIKIAYIMEEFLRQEKDYRIVRK